MQRYLKLRYFIVTGLIIVSFMAIHSNYGWSNYIQTDRINPTTTTLKDPFADLDMIKTDVINIGTEPFDVTTGTDPPKLDPEPQADQTVIIWAVNPGYRVDDQSDVGEFIELVNLSNDRVDLTGFSLYYTNSSGNRSLLLAFPDNSLMQGERVILRYSKSPEKNESDLVYTTSLAMSAGPLELWRDDDLLDELCWTGKTNCAKAFKSSNPTTLVRDLEKASFVHKEEYSPMFDKTNPGLLLPETSDVDDEATAEQPVPRCRKLEFTEVYAYYDKDKTEQFIELYNPSDQAINLQGCQLRYKKKLYALDAIIAPDEYYAYYPNGLFSLTKNPNTSNVVELIDADKQVVDELTYLHGQKKTTSYAKFYDSTGAEIWSHTYARTPGQANNYQEFRSCEAGKVINPETGNCVKADTVTDANGVCPAGKYRNPLTGRCKKIETVEAKECAPGYERNPETKRCRKVKTANTGADYTLVPTTSSGKNTFIAAGIVASIAGLGVLYVVWQFRREIVRTFRKVRQRVNDVRKDFVARSRSRDGDQ